MTAQTLTRTLLEQNKLAIEKAENTYGKLSDAYDKSNVGEVMNYLTQILELRCSKCGRNNITYNVLKFCNFDANVMCYECQHK